MIEWIVVGFSVLALFIGAYIFFLLIKLIAHIATHTAFQAVSIFFGFTLAFLLDIKFVALATAFATYAYSVEHGRWGYYAAALSFYLFVVCSANIVALLAENIRKTKFGAKLRILKRFEFNFDALHEVNKGLPDVLRMGAAFFGALGLFISFSSIIFVLSNWFPSKLFPGQLTSPLSYSESFLYALQAWIDAIPVLNTAAKEAFSKLEPAWGNFASTIGMLIVLSYKFLIYPALYNFIIKLWDVTHTSSSDESSEDPKKNSNKPDPTENQAKA